MDESLRQKVGPDGHGVTLLDDASGKVRLPDGSEHALRPLGELYSPAAAATPTTADRLRNLELNIEAAVLELGHKVRGLTDGTVLLAYDALARNPESAAPGDLAIPAIQRRLRALLSLQPYERQELRGAFRRLGKSVQKHAKGGNTAYLDAIHSHVPHQH